MVARGILDRPDRQMPKDMPRPRPRHTHLLRLPPHGPAHCLHLTRPSLGAARGAVIWAAPAGINLPAGGPAAHL